MRKGPKKTPSLSPRFNASDYDVTLQSRDQVLFKVHKKYLEMNSNGFAAPASTISTPDELVILTESSSVLELLLQYLYPGPQPDLGKVRFDVLAGVAEAAQKYEVWSAMMVTKMHMRDAVSQHGFEVLVYAAKHDFADLANEAVKFCGKASIAGAVERLNPKYLNGFARFVDVWRQELKYIRSINRVHMEGGLDGRCHHWERKVDQIQYRLDYSEGLSAELLNLFQVNASEGSYDSEDDYDIDEGEPISCGYCYKDMELWRHRYLMMWGTIKNMVPFKP